jgi:ubiquinone/menaquinone biosynthesis C-methylase UbiE
MDTVTTDREREVQAMRLEPVEFHAMNNWLRRFLQRHWEMAIFRRMLRKRSVSLEGKRILDAGCGSGFGALLIEETLRPAHVSGIDIMPEQIAIARRCAPHMDFDVGDLTQIRSDDASYDAVFVFGVLHHVPRWRDGLSEINRVLRPGGHLLVEEPRHGFTFTDFENGIRHAGFDILETQRFCLGYFRSYLARKS